MGRYPPPPLPLRRFGNIVGPDKLDFVQSPENKDPDPAQKLSLEEERRNARLIWQKMRQQESSTVGLDEIRRRAREEWRAKYGPENKT
jgi:hypothetical protein